jgi:Zn-dependent M16 (insulinase) family peptidase
LNAEEDDGKKVQIALNWLTCSIKEPLDILSLQLINLILLGHAGAPLKRVLMESQLGKSLADTTGYEDDINETFFSVGLQGIAKKDVTKVEQLILETIESIVKDGISEEQIELAIHQMELNTREVSGGHYPYSLNLLFRFFGTWMHGGDPVKAIDFDKTVDLLRTKLSEDGYLESQISKFILNNPHRVKVVLNPDHSLEKRRADKLSQELREVKSKLSPEEIKTLIQDADRLKAYQERDEDLSLLPTLHVTDIPRKIKYIPPYQSGLDGFDITYFDRPTNGIFYASWYFKLDNLSDKERSWLPTLGTLLPNLGAAGLNYNEFAGQVNRYTGGFRASPGYEKAISPTGHHLDYFTLSGKALSRNLDKLFSLAGDILNSWDFSDLDRIKSLISQRANALINSVTQSGHSYAASLAKRKFSRSAMIHEIYGGIHQVQTARELAKLDDSELRAAIEPLEQLLKKIFSQNNLSLMMVGGEEDIKKSQPLVKAHIATLQSQSSPQNPATLQTIKPEYQNEAWLTTTPVSYVAQCYRSFSYLDAESPQLLVFSNLLRSCYLHGEIREKGGAYGAMTSYDPDEGIFVLLSYRDPHFARTLDIFTSTLDWLKGTQFSEQQIEEAILRTCAKMDTPTSPAGKAAVEYSHIRKGRTKEMREAFRKGILSSTREQLIEVGTKCLDGLYSASAISSEEIIKRDAKQLEEMDLKTFSV